MSDIPDDVLKAAQTMRAEVDAARFASDTVDIIARALMAEREASAARIAELEAALREVEEVLRMQETPAFPDPLYHDEVKRLGSRIGFGALMSTASAGWREAVAAQGHPTGGEFVAGPCFSTLVSTLALVRATLTKETGNV